MTEKYSDFELRNLLHDQNKPSRKTPKWEAAVNNVYESKPMRVLRPFAFVYGVYLIANTLGFVPASQELGNPQESVISTQVVSQEFREATEQLTSGLTFDKEEMASWGYHKRPIWEKDGKLFVPGGDEVIRGSVSEKDLDKYVILNERIDAFNAAYQDKSEEQNTSAYPVIKKDKLAQILSEGRDINIKKDADFAVHAVLVTKPESQQSVSNQGKK